MNPWTIYGGLIVAWTWFAVAGQVEASVGAITVGSGFLCWTLAEYLLHRCIFHAHWEREIAAGPIQAWHQAHHADPDEPGFRVIPLRCSVPIYMMLLGGAYLLTGQLLHAGLFLSGLSIGYLGYEMVHAMVHHWTPRARLGRTLKRYHLIHHYAEPNRAFGVTSPLWDLIFHTFPKHRAPVVSAKEQNRVLTLRH